MKSDMPTVSVIVPLHNARKYIKDCLNSIVGQSYEALEIIIIDDGSTDDSVDICNEFKIKDSRISLLSQANQGPGSARNTGLAKAHGPYVFFVDSDDYIRKDTIQIAVDSLLKYDVDLVLFEAVNHFADTQEFKRLAKKKASGTVILDNNKNNQIFIGNVAIHSKKNNLTNFTECWNKLFKLDLLRRMDKDHINGMFWHEGHSLTLAYLKVIRSAVFVDMPTYTYRLHSEQMIVNNISQLFEKHYLKDTAVFKEKLLDYCRRYTGFNAEMLRQNFCNTALASAIIYIIRSVQNSGLSGLRNVYERISVIYDNHLIAEAIGCYTPQKQTDSKIFPFLARNKLVLLTIFWAKYKSIKRYGFLFKRLI